MKVTKEIKEAFLKGIELELEEAYANQKLSNFLYEEAILEKRWIEGLEVGDFFSSPGTLYSDDGGTLQARVYEHRKNEKVGDYADRLAHSFPDISTGD